MWNSGQPPDGDVAAVVELLLQLQPLVVGVDDAVLVLGSRPAWKIDRMKSFKDGSV